MRTPLPRAAASLVLLAAAGLVSGAPIGCRRDSPVQVVPDTVPPALQVVFPNPQEGFDRDSNGLLDLEVRWADSGGRINPATLRVVPVLGGVPGLRADSNLAPGWRVVRQDSAGAVLEETVAQLLAEGEVWLAVSVADSAGNVATAHSSIERLPPAFYHRAINLRGQPSCQPERGVNLALSPDGRKGFAPYHGCVAVFDPEGVAPVHFVSGVPNVGWAAWISVDTATGLAYVGGGGTQTSGFTILDTRTEQVVGTKDVGLGLASVQVVGDRIFAGEACTNGRIYVYDKRTLALLGQVEVGAVPWGSVCPNSVSFAVRRDGSEGWARIVDAGLAHFNGQTYALIGVIRLDSAFAGYLGNARGVVLLGDRWLYLARLSAGLDEFDTQPWRLSVELGDRRQASPIYKELALAPDGRSLFVSADSGGFGIAGDSIQTPYLFDVPGLTLRYAFPHRRGGIIDAAVWHPDGKRVYLMDEYQVDVYIIRPKPG